MKRALALLTCLSLLAGCGDGNGKANEEGSSPTNAGRLSLSDATIPGGATEGVIELSLSARSHTPVMVQFDLVGDMQQLQFAEEVETLQALGTVRTQRLDSGHLRVLIGDLTPKNPAELPTGALLRLSVELLDGAGPGPFEVRLENIIASDAAGDAPRFDPSSNVARISRE